MPNHSIRVRLNYVCPWCQHSVFDYMNTANQVHEIKPDGEILCMKRPTGHKLNYAQTPKAQTSIDNQDSFQQE